MKLLLVMKKECITMNLREKHKTILWCPKVEARLKPQKEIDLRRKYCTRSSSAQAGSYFKNHVESGRVSLGSTPESVLAEINRFYKRVRRNIGLRGMKHVHSNAQSPSILIDRRAFVTHILTCASQCRCISRTRSLKLCLTFTTPRNLRPVPFSCSQHLEKCFRPLGEDSTPDPPAGWLFSSVFHLHPRSSSNAHFYSGQQDLESVQLQTESVLTNCCRRRSFAVRRTHFMSRISHKNEAPS